MNLVISDIQRDESSYVATEPVTLAEAKAQCLVDFPDDDTLITNLITYSRKAIETFCNISIVPKTIFLTASLPWPRDMDRDLFGYRWDASFYGWPVNYEWNELPYGPVATVQSVTSIDTNGAITLLTLNTDYYLKGRDFVKIRLNSFADNLLIQYFTPYYCPADLKEAILNEIFFRYINRGSGLNRYASQNVGASEGAQYLAKQYQRRWL